jgi:sporulation protein YlmC with PRC-barrel domain
MRLPPEDLRGLRVRDRDGEVVGLVADLYVERPTGEVRYLAVHGDVRRMQVLVPLDEVTVVEDGVTLAVVVPYTREHLMAAPPIEEGRDPSIALEGEIHSHFERTPYWDDVRARQTTPAPTPEIAAADAAAAAEGASDLEVYEARRTEVAARQTEPAPTTRIADAEVEDALARGHDPAEVRVKRWGT